MSRSELEALYVPLRKIARLPQLAPAHPEPREAPSLIPLFFLGLVGAAFMLLHFAYYHWQMVDDAFITYRYAENLARTGMARYNLNEAAEGFSNPLWTLQLALGIRCGAPVIPFSRVLGMASGLGLLWWGLGLLRWFGRRVDAGPWAEFSGALAWTLLIATSNIVIVNCQMGLETSQHALLLALAFGGAVLAGATGRRRWMALGALAMGLVMLSRPEGFGYYVPWLVAWLMQGPGAEPGARKRALIRKICRFFPLLVLGGLLGFRYAAYHQLLPLTVGAKSAMNFSGAQLLRGAEYLHLAYAHAIPSWVLLMLLAALMIMFLPGLGFPWPVSRALCGLLTLTAANCVFAVLVGGDFMGYSRLLMPAVFPVTLWLALSLLMMLARAGYAPNPPRISYIQTLLLALLTLLIAYRQFRCNLHLYDPFERQKAVLAKGEFYEPAVTALLTGQVLQAPFDNVFTSGLVPLAVEQFPANASVLVGDIGVFGFSLPDVRIIDSAGLITPEFSLFLRDRGKPQLKGQRMHNVLAKLDADPPAYLVLFDYGTGLMLGDDLPATAWPKFNQDYVPATVLNDYAGPLKLDLARQRFIFRRRDVRPPGPEVITARYLRLANQYPLAPEARAFLEDWQARAASYLPFVLEASSASEAAGNRVRVGDMTLAGTQFLGRFDGVREVDGWTMHGQAFRQQPRLDPNFGQQPPTDFQGRGYLNSFHPAERETAVGRADSPQFVPGAGDYLLFWSAGGTGPKVGVNLMVAGLAVRHWSGFGHNRLVPQLVDLTPWAGQPVTISVIDNDKQEGGWCLADHFVMMRRSF